MNSWSCVRWMFIVAERSYKMCGKKIFWNDFSFRKGFALHVICGIEKTKQCENAIEHLKKKIEIALYPRGIKSYSSYLQAILIWICFTWCEISVAICGPNMIRTIDQCCKTHRKRIKRNGNPLGFELFTEFRHKLSIREIIMEMPFIWVAINGHNLNFNAQW